jgi:cobalt-zinc-cadmium efflux system outer membrane protein
MTREASLIQAALEKRPDLRARQAAVAEADARVRLATADRFGNPNLGPAYEYDPTRINLIGAQLSLPLPVFNVRRGEIEQRKAELVRAELDVRQLETTIPQDVRAAFDRFHAARDWATTYERETLPDLRAGVKELDLLFAQASADILRVIDSRRKLLRSREGYLDALFELNQARADLAAAIGDMSLALMP